MGLDNSQIILNCDLIRLAKYRLLITNPKFSVLEEYSQAHILWC